jgi:bifunctional lysine-specific demethylase and histidyl-hydroxylase MINA
MQTRTTSTRIRPTPTPTTPIATQTTRTTSAALARCLDPVESERFLQEYWEAKPLLVQRGEKGRFDDLLSIREAEHLITSTGLRYPAFRLVRADADLAKREYTTDVSWRPVPFSATIDVTRVAEEFERGATIVLQGLHLHHAPLARFARELEQELGQPVQVNAYYTPRAAQGLPVHHDTHDVMCLQVAGEKRWLVYEPALELPLKEQRYRPEHGEPSEPVLDVTLGPGDTLYLPRGWLHQALTSDNDSLHLTVGLSPYTWFDAVKSALEECAGEVAYRRSVPDDGQTDDDLLAALEERLHPDEVTRRRRDRLARTRRPILDDQLEQVRALERLTRDTLVERRPTVIATLTDTGIVFEGREVTVPEHAREELESLFRASAPVAPRDLPGRLDDEGRLVLVRRLVREGFLRAVDPGQGDGSSPRIGGGA